MRGGVLLPEGRRGGQQYVFTTLPDDLGFDGAPVWWPLPVLALGGLVVGLTIRYLPGTGGHVPAEGFKSAGAVPPVELPGIIIAAFATLAFGAVLGPEAPLIAIGSGMGVLAVQLVRRDAPKTASVVIAAAGSFAAVSTLFGSPLTGAFLLMEVSGLGARCSESCSSRACSPLAWARSSSSGWTRGPASAPSRSRSPTSRRSRRRTSPSCSGRSGSGLPARSSEPAFDGWHCCSSLLVERRAVLLTPVAGIAVARLGDRLR